MANVEHSSLTDPNLHEPKGITSAAADEVYVANGSSTGAWKTIYTQGWEDVADDASGAQALTASSWVDLTNDGAGSNSNSTYLLPGFSSCWDTANNQFVWNTAGLSLGDVVDLRVDVNFTTSAANDEVGLRLDLGHGDLNEYSLEIFRQSYKAAGTYNVVVNCTIYMGNTLTLNNPAKIAAFSDSATDTCTVNGFFVKVLPRNPVFL